MTTEQAAGVRSTVEPATTAERVLALVAEQAGIGRG